MVFVQELMPMDYSMALAQPSLQQFNSYQNYTNKTICRICGISVSKSNIHRHLNRRHWRRSNGRSRPKPKSICDPLIDCEHCDDKVRKSYMDGHLLRKHDIYDSTLQPNIRPAGKRKRNEIDDEGTQVVEQQLVKRQRYDANQTIMDALNEAFVERPQTPPLENLIDTEQGTEVTEDTEVDVTTEETPAFPITKIEKKTYNLVHISDGELNKLMLGGRISILNGHLYRKDS